MELNMARKRRNDRNHVIYQLTAPNGERYVGITFARGRAFKRSAKIRWEAHVRNALDYDRQNLLSVAIREQGIDGFRREVLEIIRGKQNAHNRERELIAATQPELNMEGMGRKINSIKTQKVVQTSSNPGIIEL
tara:strand:- start:5051 stop:5452 length:402 start_codon:yes stop_codon:yes gene_type:complete